ncbi:MAG: tetratricopeptide repeat protein [Bacteroidota bacterium]
MTLIAGLLLAVIESAFTQSPTIDSLKNELTQAEHDTARIRLNIELGIQLRNTNKDSALQCLRSAIPLAVEHNERQSLYNIWIAMAMTFNSNLQQDSALNCLFKAKDEAVKLRDKWLQVNALKRIASTHNMINNKALSIDHFQQALTLAEEMEERQERGIILNAMGNVYSGMADYERADSVLKEALRLYNQLGDKDKQSSVLGNLGNNAARSNDLRQAIDYYEDALKLIRSTGDRPKEASVFRVIGYSAFVLGDYPLALEYYQQALNIFEEMGFKKPTKSCLENLGEVYTAMEEYDQALSYYERALSIALAVGNRANQPNILFKKGQIYILKKEYNSALQVLIRAVKIRKEANQKIGPFQHELLRSTGFCYKELNQPDSAIIFLNEAIEIAYKANNFFGKAESLIYLAEVYNQQGKSDLAISSLQQSIEAASFSGNKEWEMEAAKRLYQIFKSQNNSNQALRYHELFRNLQDSLFNEKNVKQIAKLEAGYEFEKEKQQLAFEAEQEIKRQQSFQRIALVALGVSILFILTFAWFYRSKQKDNAKLSHLNEELKKQKSVVENQKEKLEELDEMKSRFFTNISHEFRTPLTIISGMAGQVYKRPELWAKKGAQMIRQNSNQLLQLVNQILDLRKLESKEMKVNLVFGDVVQYLKYITDSHQSFAKSKGLDVHFLSAKKSIKMDYDPDKLLRIISNLMSNAIKYTKDGGNIYFHIDDKEEKGKNHLQIRVEDTGSGIPEDQLSQIFDRFYQVDHSRTKKEEGTGIGLALVKEMVQLLGGEITVESEVGTGTSFIVLLPITKKATVQSAEHFETASGEGFDTEMESVEIEKEEQETSPIISSPTFAKPRLLVVEDNQDIAQFLVACLQDRYELELAPDGQAGIDLAVEQTPDLIISDVMMPKKDGFELCDTLKKDERTSHIPIILLTAKVDHQSKISGLKKGADAYLTKPFEPEELEVRLAKLFELRKRLQARYAGTEIPENESESNDHQIEDEFLQKIRKLLEENLSDSDFGIPQISRGIGMSRSQIFRKVKALTGRSPSQFIRSIRLYKAKDLLKNSELNVSEVAYETGFASPVYFSNAFLEEFGLRPNDARS